MITIPVIEHILLQILEIRRFIIVSFLEFGIFCKMVSKFEILNQSAAYYLAANLKHFDLVCVLGLRIKYHYIFYLKL
jgi:hypothetical protein